MLGTGFRGHALVIVLAIVQWTATSVLASQNEQSPFGPLGVESETMPNPGEGILRLDIVVTDESGNPKAGLVAKDFAVLDNSHVRPIVSFRGFNGLTAEPNPPVKVILVIDELDLPPIQLAQEEQEAERFLLQNQGHLSQPVCIYRINSRGLFASAGPSVDGNLLADEIAHKTMMRTIRPSSMLRADHSSDHIFLDLVWHEMAHSIVALGAIAIEERRKPGRKLMFWLGPGWEINQGHRKGYFDVVTELSTRLREARIELWNATEWPRYDSHGHPITNGSIYQDFLPGVKSEKDVTFGNLALQVVATQSGGV